MSASTTMEVRRLFAAMVDAVVTEKVRRQDDCKTCGGAGEIDATLGGEPFCDPHAPCPDCQQWDWEL